MVQRYSRILYPQYHKALPRLHHPHPPSYKEELTDQALHPHDHLGDPLDHPLEVWKEEVVAEGEGAVEEVRTPVLGSLIPCHHNPSL